IYGITTQVQRNFYESTALRRSVSYEIKGIKFNYYKLKKEFYFDFVRQNDLFISTKEKAFIDAIYLYSLGRYSIDINSLDLKKLEIKRIKSLYRPFPERTKKIIREICKI
ncbi:MAG: hypothetical protein N3A65_08660, partial [candidate division WOR-3 bacterium]|nr:hypothetical protein [candidate division WOR-3 bacterium]